MNVLCVVIWFDYLIMWLVLGFFNNAVIVCTKRNFYRLVNALPIWVRPSSFCMLRSENTNYRPTRLDVEPIWNIRTWCNFLNRKMQLNRFRAIDPNNFILIEGMPFVTTHVRIIRPIHHTSKSPEFTLFAYGNKPVSCFTKVSDCSDNVLIGRQKDSTLIWFWRGDFGFDLFRKNMPLNVVKEKLLRGELNNEFNLTRE